MLPVPTPGQKPLPPTPAIKDALKTAAETCKKQFEGMHSGHHHGAEADESEDLSSNTI